MDRQEAKYYAETVTNKQLQDMLIKASKSITKWTATSTINKGCTIGTTWNILSRGYLDPNFITTEHSRYTKINMLREFGKYLDGYVKIKKEKKKPAKVTHQNPIF